MRSSPSTDRRGIVRLGLTFVLLVTAVVGAAQPASAASRPAQLAASSVAASTSAQWCQCIIYVQNYVGYLSYYAKDAGPALQAKGFRAYTYPQINDIAVMQPGLAGVGYAGHIGFVSSYYWSGSWIHVTLRATNQPGGWWTDHGCYNVSLWGFWVYANDSRIRFYRR